MIQTIKAVLSDQQGQGLAEYALVLALVSIAAIAALTALGGKISSTFTTVTSAI